MGKRTRLQENREREARGRIGKPDEIPIILTKRQRRQERRQQMAQQAANDKTTDVKDDEKGDPMAAIHFEDCRHKDTTFHQPYTPRGGYGRDGMAIPSGGFENCYIYTKDEAKQYMAESLGIAMKVMGLKEPFKVGFEIQDQNGNMRKIIRMHDPMNDTPTSITYKQGVAVLLEVQTLWISGGRTTEWKTIPEFVNFWKDRKCS